MAQRLPDGQVDPRISAFEFDRELIPAALENAGAVIEGLASIARRGVREYEELPLGTGRARLASGNVGKAGYPFEQAEELVRLIQRIRSPKWGEQLERGTGPNLLIVRTNTIFGSAEPASVGAAARRVADALHEHLRKLSMIGAVLVYEEPLWPPQYPITAILTDLRVRIDTSPTRCARFMALVPNKHALEPLTDAEMDRLVGPEPIW